MGGQAAQIVYFFDKWNVLITAEIKRRQEMFLCAAVLIKPTSSLHLTLPECVHTHTQHTEIYFWVKAICSKTNGFVSMYLRTTHPSFLYGRLSSARSQGYSLSHSHIYRSLNQICFSLIASLHLLFLISSTCVYMV